MRNKCLAILSGLMITCTSNMVSEDLILEKIITVEQDEGMYPSNNFPHFQCFNSKDGHIIWFYSGDICPGVYGHIINYSDRTLDGGNLRLNQTLADFLLDLGFEPISWKTLDGNKWNGKIYVNFSICPLGIDDFGSVLISFQHVGKKDLNNQYPRKLCVWNLNKGFRLLPIEGIENVSGFLKDNTLIVRGVDESRTIEKLSILSIANGLWPDEKVEEPTPEPTKNWWDKIKPFLWPK